MIRSAALVFIASVFLSACGFQLRGSMPVEQVGQVYVSDQVPIQQRTDQPVSDQLLDQLQAMTGEVLTGPFAGVPGIVITREQTQERALSLSANLLNRQVAIEKRIDYQIVDASGEVLRTDYLSARRDMTQSQNNPGANNQERAQLIEAINSDLSRQLIHQLDRLLESPEA